MTLPADSAAMTSKGVASSSDSADLQHDSRRFRGERESEWRRLEAIVERAERKGVKALEDDDLLALPVLYRAPCHPCRGA